MDNENLTVLQKKDRDVTDELNEFVKGDPLLEAWEEYCEGKLIRFASLDRRFPETGVIGDLKIASDAPYLASKLALPDHLFNQVEERKLKAESEGRNKPSLYVVKALVKERLIAQAAEKGMAIQFDYRLPDNQVALTNVEFVEYWTPERERERQDYFARKRAEKKGNSAAVAINQAQEAPTL